MLVTDVGTPWVSASGGLATCIAMSQAFDFLRSVLGVVDSSRKNKPEKLPTAHYNPCLVHVQRADLPI